MSIQPPEPQAHPCISPRSVGAPRGRLRRVTVGPAIAFIVMLVLTSHSSADIDPASGIDFVRITHPGNAPFTTANPNDFANGRGGVDYQYGIGRMEVTTSQWVEFFNAAYDRDPTDRIPHLELPTFWGAGPAIPHSPGGLRFSVPLGNENRPVGNISWRMAAIYTNWLCNNKGTQRSAFLSGAYDVSTFATLGGEQRAHTPGARYWIPTWDETLKASHYDSQKANTDGSIGGWWTYGNGSDTPYVYGPPGVTINGQPTQANAGWDNRMYPGRNPFTIPLGAYPAVQSPWGLLDVAGGTTEWTESVRIVDTVPYRVFDGSWWSLDPGGARQLDTARTYGEELSYIPTLEFGLRIATSVPSPGTCAAGVGVFLTIGCFRRRR